MSQLSSEHLWNSIDRLLPRAASGAVLVAFSGGLDSTVLLHALTSTPDARRQRVRAMHIDHQLHSESARWREHCLAVAGALGVPCLASTVTIGAAPGDSLEAAARAARYDALREALRPGEALLTAHHADDQLETLLLALLRGSGVDGLAAMPRCRRFGKGWQLRPLLDCTREELSQWAAQQRVVWLDDPSNASSRFDRNYLRSAVVPRLRDRWPAVSHSAVRAAAHLGEAAELLDEIAAHDFATASVGQCLEVAALKNLNPARRRNLLRYWLDSRGARAPSTRKLAALEHDMLAAREDRSPCVAWDDVEVRRHRGFMYCIPRLPAQQDSHLDWEWSAPLRLDQHAGLLRAEIAHGRGLARARLPDRLRLGLRRGGECLRLPGHAHHRPLKKLLQEANVLPWWRSRLPLLFLGDTLVAVADLWVNADFAADDHEEGVRIVWEERPQIVGVVATS